jgi:hypothetical protein
MGSWTRRFALASFAPTFVFAQVVIVTDRAAPTQPAPMIVQVGAPFHVALEKQVRVKSVGVAVEGRVVEPIYVFDRMAIPAGTRFRASGGL